MIQANCRDRFTAEDFRFISEVLSHNTETKRAALIRLLSHPQTRDVILDDRSLFAGITGHASFQQVSPFLYFYLLTRHVFLQYEIMDRMSADYVACMLAQFCSAKRTWTISHAHDRRYEYFVDMMSDSLQASSFEAFLLRSHIGNYALFMTGIFPDRIYCKSTYGRRAPGFDYYEKMGRSSFRWASQHKLAVRFSLEGILAGLAERFSTIRMALNQIADEYMHIDERTPGMDKVMRQILFGRGNNPETGA